MKGTISFFYNNALIPIPTKGTMPGSFKRVFNYKCFNLRTREGYDNIIFASSSYVEHFNPRTHEGYDINQARLSEIDTILIPVPIKGTIRTHT